ncbi:TetR family transcriptional regulator [Clostridium kluyveri]|uniref:TetR family transcriptional regulator n=1 Tax=Clostridium kluyveri TaxID=1534 RepID=A0A1L5FE03_CLOKL|nr:TetR family transcriptional regulator [Clostridium kluyveri]
MFSKFLSLSEEKQQRILNAALKEFAQKGYKNASTNQIVQDADISKGLLFHYFKNKKQLFLFLYDYCIELSMKEFYKKINLDEKDFFVKLRQIQLIKLELLNKYPEILKFIEVANVEESSDVKNDLEVRNKEAMNSASSKVFENIDVSKFRENVDVKRAINVVMWTFQGFNARVLEDARLSPSRQINYEKAIAEMDIYKKMLENCFYK